jgi:hypothetical protein
MFNILIFIIIGFSLPPSSVGNEQKEGGR